MNNKRAIVISLALHSFLLVLLVSGISFKFPGSKKLSLPLQAQLMVKKRDKNLLPKKAKKLEHAQPVEKEPAQAKSAAVPKHTGPAKKSQAKAEDFMKTLSSLSQSFAHDIAAKEEYEVLEPSDDSSYFDQVFSLVKASFIVPPHINGPKGRSLKSTIRLFLSTEGDLLKLDLVLSSGDEHFDKAIMEGVRRIHNFGAVPIFLQASLSADGLLIDLCPFTCEES